MRTQHNLSGKQTRRENETETPRKTEMTKAQSVLVLRCRFFPSSICNVKREKKRRISALVPCLFFVPKCLTLIHLKYWIAQKLFLLTYITYLDLIHLRIKKKKLLKEKKSVFCLLFISIFEFLNFFSFFLEFSWIYFFQFCFGVFEYGFLGYVNLLVS